MTRLPRSSPMNWAISPTPKAGDGTRFALGGTRTDDEQRADAVGIILLRTSGIPPASLAHALAKVRDAPANTG